MTIIQYGGIRIDVRANTEGVKSLRTDMASLSREFAKTMTPVEKLESKLSKVAAQIKKHGEATAFTDRATIGAVNTYLEAEKAAGRYAEAIDFVAKRLPELAATMRQLDETRRRQEAEVAAATAQKQRAELDKALLAEKIEREKQAAAISKKIDKELEASKVAAAKAANDQQKQLMQQLADVEDFFDKRALARRKAYLDHKLRLEKEAMEAEKLAAKEASIAKEALDEQERQRVKRRRREEYQIADAVFKKIDQDAKDRARAKEALDEQERQRVKRRRREEFQAADAVFKKIDQESQGRARAQRMVNAILRESISPVDQLRMRLEKLRAETDKGRISQEQFAKASQAVNAKIAAMQVPKATGSGAGQFATSFVGGISPVGALTAGALGFAAGQKTLEFAKDSVAAYMDMRSALIKLEVTLGSASKAKVMFEQLRLIAAQMSLTSEAVLNGAVTMAQFGVTAQQLEPAMRRLAIVSSGNSERLQSLAIAYGQVAAAGRLTGQETLQFVNAGFNPLAEIARTTGKSMAQLRKEMENGQITVKMVAEAFRTATEAGGRFFGMAEKLSDELSGKLNKVKSEITKIKEELAGLAIDVIQGPETAEKANENLQQFRKGINVIRTDLRALMQGGPSLIGETFKSGESDAQTMQEIQRNLVTGKTFAEREVEKALERIKRLDEAEAFFKTKAESIPILADEVIKNTKEGFKFFFDEAKNVSRNVIVPIAQKIDADIKKRADEIRKSFEQLAESIEEGRRKRAESIRDSIMTPAEQQAKQVAELADLVRFKFLSLDEASKFLAKGQSSQDSFSTDLPKAVSIGTKEAYELVMRTQSTLQAKQLDEQRRQRLAQEAANKLLEEIKNKPAVGIVN